jgi:hypothetical protein
VRAAVINARFLRPLDEALILPMARRIGRVVTMEEGCLAGGFGAAVVETLNDHDVLVPVLRIGIPDVLVDHASPDQSKQALGLTPPQMADTILERFPASRSIAGQQPSQSPAPGVSGATGTAWRGPAGASRRSDDAAGGQAEDRAHAEEVTQAQGAEHGAVAEATEQGGIGQLQAHIGLLDRGLADGDGNHIAHDHHQGHLGGPGDRGGSHGQGLDQEGREHGALGDGSIFWARMAPAPSP